MTQTDPEHLRSYVTCPRPARPLGFYSQDLTTIGRYKVDGESSAYLGDVLTNRLGSSGTLDWPRLGVRKASTVTVGVEGLRVLRQRIEERLQSHLETQWRERRRMHSV